MEPDRWKKIEDLYHSARALQPSERPAFVRSACAGDESLQTELESLLLEVDEDQTFLETPAINLAARHIPLAEERAVAPTAIGASLFPAAIGRYRIIALLGEGGMGLVYEAEQDQPRRSVALKIIKPGFATAQGIRRFEYESKALGRLQHAGIAQIYEASTAETGFGRQPYFAMELIRGQSLLKYADALSLDIRRRLTLIAKICEAVDHAHQRGLIHRDLKPGNILVDETGQPKILDFGVARVTEADSQFTRQTDVGQIVGTLAYMSPEQVLANPAEVDARSDVYSLGVILYELLAGRLPHEVSHSQIHEAMQAILEEDPPPLSTFNRQCRGDVEIIVGKALEREKVRRYASAADLAADIHRYLNNQPITARPPSATYQLHKFTRRHRGLVIGVLSTFLVLLAGIVVSTQQAVRANQAERAALLQRDRATTEAQTAEAVQKFIEDIFDTNSSRQSDPVNARKTTARQLLDIGAGNVDTELNQAPAARERMLGILSELYYGLGLSEEAVTLDRKRVAAAKSAFGLNDPRVAVALTALGSSLHASREVNEREAVLLEAKAILDRNHDFTSLTRARLLLVLAEHYQSGDKQKALQFATQGVNLYRKLPPGPGLSSALYQQSQIYGFEGQNAKAAASLSEAVAIAQTGKTRDPDLPIYAAILGETDIQLLQYDEARKNLELAARTARAFSGAEHVDTIESEGRLGSFFTQVSDYPEALIHLKHAYDTCTRTKGKDDPFYTPQMSLMYGYALAASGQLEEGLSLISQAVESRRKSRPDTRYFAQMLSTQASVLADLGDYRKARRNLDEADLISRKVGFSHGSDYQIARLKLAFAANDPQAVASTIDTAYGRLADQGSLSLNLLKNLSSRTELALIERRPAEAALLARRTAGLVSASPVRSYLKIWEARAALNEGNSYLLQHRAASALPRLQFALRLYSEMYDARSIHKLPVHAALGIAYLQLGDRNMAATHLAQAASIRKLHRAVGRQYETPLQTLQRLFHQAGSASATP